MLSNKSSIILRWIFSFPLAIIGMIITFFVFQLANLLVSTTAMGIFATIAVWFQYIWGIIIGSTIMGSVFAYSIIYCVPSYKIISTIIATIILVIIFFQIFAYDYPALTFLKSNIIMTEAILYIFGSICVTGYNIYKSSHQLDKS